MATNVSEWELRELLKIGAVPEPSPTAHQANARYLTSLDGFNIKRPPVPAHVFLAERDQALSPRAPTGLVPLDLSRLLELDFPATTPLILARYARVRAGETLATEVVASAELYYVMAGSGTTHFGENERIDWEPGDAFGLPGGSAVRHEAGPSDAVLWMVTNEPQLAFERCRPPTAAHRTIRPVHYPTAEIRHQLLRVHLDPRGAKMAGKSVNFGNVAVEHDHTTTPSFTLAMNSLLPGTAQQAHRHNAVAVTLVVAGEGCYSLIEGKRIDWEPNAVMITPPADLHSHHNDGRAMALFFIVQDGGLHYHCRTMGFSYA